VRVAGYFVGATVAGLILIGAGMLAAMQVSDYHRERAAGLRISGDEAIRAANADNSELEAIYGVCRREPARCGTSK
jgi:hypothetical protein